MTPQKLGRYEILGEVGHGGMATVYHATDPSFGREVAIKVLPIQMQHHPQFRERFLREGRTIAALEHPGIVPVYDVGEEDNVPFLVMRYMPGGTLAERIPEAGMPLAEASRILSRIAPALDEAHRRGIVHRDLKPANILFDAHGEGYISDFGIAKLTEDQAQLTGSGVIGTPTYMSPEQASGAGVDSRSDIYSLGVVLYEMLTRRLPFESETPMGIAVKHITDPIPNILAVKDDLPEGLRLVIHKVLAKDPSHRYQTASDFAADVAAVTEGKRTQVAGEPAPEFSTLPMAAAPVPPQNAAVGRRASAPLAPTLKGDAPRQSPTMLIAAIVGGISLLALLAVLIFRPPSQASPPATDEATEAVTSTPTDRPDQLAEITNAPTESADSMVAAAAPLVDQDVTGIEALTVEITLGPSELVLTAADEGVTSVQAIWEGDAGINLPQAVFEPQSRAAVLRITQDSPDIFVIGTDPMGKTTISLPRDVPLDLTLDTGFGDAVIDLTDLNVRSLTLLKESGPMRIFLPSSSDIAIQVNGTFSDVTFEAPDNSAGLTIREFTLAETIGVVRIDLPLAGVYSVSVNAYGEVDFVVPDALEVTLSVPAELVTVAVQNPRFEETEGRVWQTDGSQGEANRVTIEVSSTVGTIKLLPE